MPMATDDHDEVVRRSFERQVHLFSGPNSPFAHRAAGALTWIEPLSQDMILLDGVAASQDPMRCATGDRRV